MIRDFLFGLFSKLSPEAQPNGLERSGKNYQLSIINYQLSIINYQLQFLRLIPKNVHLSQRHIRQGFTQLTSLTFKVLEPFNKLLVGAF